MKDFNEYFEIKNIGNVRVFSLKSCANTLEIAKKCFEYFFDLEIMFNHINYLDDFGSFDNNKKNAKLVYTSLKKFLEEEYDFECVGSTPLLNAIIIDEFGSGNKYALRNDKIGKIGEYFLSIIIENYFKFDCFIDKLTFVTSRNMPIYGIDTIHYSSSSNILFFGESKLTKTLENGVALINESLSKYEEQLKNEFELIITSEHKKYISFNEKIGKAIDEAFSVEEFIKLSEIESIGIPLFICHGGSITDEKIKSEFGKLSCKNTFCGLNTSYILLDLQISDKKEFIHYLAECLSEKERSLYAEFH